MRDRLYKSLRALGSTKLTLVCVVLAGTIALLGESAPWSVGTAVAVPFGLMFVNLTVAVATNGKLRSRVGLLGFHLALACFVLLLALDRMMAFYGHVEITEGADFDPRLVTAEAGPLHPWKLDGIGFTQGGFEIAYAPKMKRRETRSRVFLSDPAAPREIVVGDDDPLVIGDYRFYTSFNKGFAPVLGYMNPQGVVLRGAVHLPSYPLNSFNQGNEWTVPGSEQKIKIWLHLPEPVYRPEDVWRFRMPEDATLVVIQGDRRHELRPGESVPLSGGRLRYEELRSWMGYTISYNPLVPWMIGAAVVALGFLLMHMLLSFRAVPWSGTEGHGANAV